MKQPAEVVIGTCGSAFFCGLLLMLVINRLVNDVAIAAVLAFALSGVAHWQMLVRRQTKSTQAWRRRQNQCVVCGYDLRATVDRCPECGTPVAN